jgi:hypothetical protein
MAVFEWSTGISPSACAALMRGRWARCDEAVSTRMGTCSAVDGMAPTAHVGVISPRALVAFSISATPLRGGIEAQPASEATKSVTGHKVP